MASKPKSRHDRDDEDTLMDRPAAKAAPEQRAASELTVTVANVTPPTNLSFVSFGSPPSTPGLTPQDDGWPGSPGPITAIAPPTSGAACEAAGTVVVDNSKPGAVSLTVMGNFTNSPNSSHPSAGAPAVPPTITGLVPPTTLGTGGTMTLTVNGTGFEEGAVVNVGGVAMVTEFISATQLQAENAPKRTTPGTTPVTVTLRGTTTAPTNWTFT